MFIERKKILAGIATVAVGFSGLATAATCVGRCGSAGAAGVVTLPPDGSPSYGYVSTFGGVNGVAVGALPGVGGAGTPTNGSVFTSNTFAALAGEQLSFSFNFVTSDGSGYADYGWAQLLDNTGNQVALLFTARTTPDASSVPGFAMPAPAATLTPSTVDIIGGAPSFSPLGTTSGECYATGCGYTDWVNSSYTIAADGSYSLQFGVTNWDDQSYSSALAFAGAKVGDISIDVTPVPLPASLWMMLGGLSLGLLKRRRRT